MSTGFTIIAIVFVVAPFIVAIFVIKATPIKDMNDKVLEEEEFNRNR